MKAKLVLLWAVAGGMFVAGWMCHKHLVDKAPTLPTFNDGVRYGFLSFAVKGGDVSDLSTLERDASNLWQSVKDTLGTNQATWVFQRATNPCSLR